MKNIINIESRGRKTVMTPEIIAKLEEAFSLGCTDVEACFMANIGKTTLYNYQNTHPDFMERKEQLKDSLILQARHVIYDALQNNDKEMAKWYLERKKKSEFSTKSEVAREDVQPIIPKIEILPVAVMHQDN